MDLPENDPFGLGEIPPEAIDRNGMFQPVKIADPKNGKAKADTVFVKILPLDAVSSGKLTRALGNEGDFLSLVTGKNKKWVNSLTIKSQEDLLRLGRQLNFPTLLRWAERMKEDYRALDMIISMLETGLQKVLSPLARSFARLQDRIAECSTSSILGK